MTNENKHDPVNALAEADATGRTAEIFAEIRELMEIPLITSIWRTLAAVEDGLESAWAATRPLYESGQPQAVLEKLKAQANFPVPGKRSIEQLEEAGYLGQDRSTILTILDAYNRSNGLNLIALTALVSNSDGQSSSYSRPPSPAPWPTLPLLLSKEEINTADWQVLERIKHIGATDDNPSIPTLWRHLMHWPGLLELILNSYLPLHQNGTINRDIEEVRKFAESEAPALSNFKSSTDAIPDEAIGMIRSYVGHPPSVTRMVTVGHGVVRWLEGSSSIPENLPPPLTEH